VILSPEAAFPPCPFSPDWMDLLFGKPCLNSYSPIFIVGPSIFVALLQNNQQMHRGSSSTFVNAFLDLPQHVLASHCHHQGVMVSSEATQAVCTVDAYGLRPPDDDSELPKHVGVIREMH
jgi:hypothetical protein